MIREILEASGLDYRDGDSALRLPNHTTVYIFEDVELDGPDSVTPPADAWLPGIYRHDIRLEMYELQADPAAEAALEAQLRARGLTYKKYGRDWLQKAQRYLVNYELSYTAKT